jgi:hypothetical protein
MAQGTKWFFRFPALTNAMVGEPLSHPQTAQISKTERSFPKLSSAAKDGHYAAEAARRQSARNLVCSVLNGNE